MKLSAVLFLAASLANGLYIVEERSDGVSVGYDSEDLAVRSGLSPDSVENTYQVGVRAFKDRECKGHPSATCNHDEDSCNGGCYGPKWHVNGIAAKSDGSANGHGCMTVFPVGHNCQGKTFKVFTLRPNDCHHVSKEDLGFQIGCVVVSSRTLHETCDPTPDNC